VPDTSTLSQDPQKANLQLVKSTLEESSTVIHALERAGLPISIPNLLPFGCHDAGNSQRLVAVFKPYLRYCHDFNKWLIYDGRRWAVDGTDQAKVAATYVMGQFLLQAVNSSGNRSLEDYARRSLDSRYVNNALAMAKGHIYVSADKLDQDPYLLNCANGTLDLSHPDTGFTIRPHSPKDFITKLVHHSYFPDAECPRFTAFLDRIMGGGPKANVDDQARSARMVSFLQRAFGSALTGDVTDKAVFCFFGQGDNGKTTLLETIRYVISEYSTQVLIDTLVMHKQRDTGTSMSDLASLRGARFATTSETEEGQRFGESKLKYLVSGMGQIETCRKYENPIYFQPTHHLFIDGNYRPVVHGGDAIWDRLRFVPFSVRIPKHEIDRKLGEKLKGEAEGILRWLVDGCLDWYWYRLKNPPEINEAIQDWRDEDNPLTAFLSECCELAPELPEVYSKSSDLWRAYLAWVDREKERHPATRAGFAERLTQLGCQPCLRRFGGETPIRAWQGIRPKLPKKVSNEPD
jgi:putative DNA primase/helicase